MQSESKDSGGSLRTRQLSVVLKRAEVAESELSEARKKIERLTKRNERLTKHLDLAGTLSAGPHDHEYADRLRSEWDKSERQLLSALRSLSEAREEIKRLNQEFMKTAKYKAWKDAEQRAKSAESERNLLRQRIADAKDALKSPDFWQVRVDNALAILSTPPAQGEGKGVSK